MRHLVRVRRGVVLLAAVVAAACSGGSTPAQDAQPAAAPATSAAPVERVTEYPRPAKPSKTYRIGIAVPHLSNPHYIGQAYGYLDEAEQLGVQATLLEAGGYQYLDKQVSQIEDLVASKVDAIIIAAVSGPGTAPAVDAAVADPAI